MSAIVNNFFWRFFERIGAQLVTFVVSIVLARILDPSVYGTVALVTVITGIMQVFIDSGLGSALIQKKDADDLDFSTVFFFNMGVCVVLYILVYLIAPFVASFYGNSELVPLIRILGLTLLISGVKNIQQAYVSRNMLFKRFFFSTLGGTVGAAVVGIWMAYSGYGVWALVAQYLFNSTIDTLILWITVKWRPRLQFSFDRLKSLFKYGWKLLVSVLLETGYKDLRQLIIGKLYTSSDLAYYNRGEQFPKVIVTNINSSIDSVLFPTMSKEQDDRDRVKNMARRAIKVSTYVMSPLMIGLAVCAEPIVGLLLTEKWLPCVPYLRIFCIEYMFWPIHTANLNAIKAMGRSDLFLKLEIWKKIVGVLILIFAIRYGVLAMAYSLLLASLASQIINTWPNKKLLNYTYLNQLKDIIPAILLALFMGAVVYCVRFLGFGYLITLILQIIVGAGIYISGSAVLRLDSFSYVLEIAKGFIKRAR